MKALKQLERLKRMNELIRKGKTGTPDEFASSIGISRRQLYADLDFIKDNGVDINYSKISRTFYYTNEHELEISFQLRVK